MSKRSGVRCAQCMSLLVALVAAGFTGSVWADVGPAAEISPEVWLGLFATVLFSLLAGYAKGQERRITGLEFESRQQQAQINMLSERVLREHPSRSETNEHRLYVETQLQHIRDRLDDIARR